MYFYDYLWLVWLAISFLCLIIELTSGDFYVTCFAIGSLVTIPCAILYLPLWMQILVFAIASLLCIFFVRPSLLRWLHGKGKERKSNADALIGKRAIVSEAIPADSHGYVKIDGDQWRAISSDASAIAQGTRVTVVERNSTILTVAPISK